MNSIGDFFDKFKNIALFELRKREVIGEIIEKYTSKKIDAKDINIRDGTAYVKCDSALRSEIFLKKGKILGEVSQKLPKLKIVDIK